MPGKKRGGGDADIRAVAARAGVATSSVSRFLNGKKRLGADTERRIREAADLLGYAPNRLARSLRVKSTQTLALLIPDIAKPHIAGLVKGVEEVVQAAGFALMLFSTRDDPEFELSHLRTLQALRCDGVVLVPAPRAGKAADPWRGVESLRLPLVCVDRAVAFPVDTVITDGVTGAYEAVSHLLKLGHRRVGLLSVDVSNENDRRIGYARALAEAGVARRPEFDLRARDTAEDGFSAATKLLAMSEPPSALFVSSTALTMGAMAAIRARAGLRCPRDISVIGWDSHQWPGAFEPGLSMVHEPVYLAGQRAAALLLDRIAGRKVGPPERILLPTNLELRDSCARVGVPAGLPTERRARPRPRDRS